MQIVSKHLLGENICVQFTEKFVNRTLSKAQLELMNKGQY